MYKEIFEEILGGILEKIRERFCRGIGGTYALAFGGIFQIFLREFFEKLLEGYSKNFIKNFLGIFLEEVKIPIRRVK